MLLLNAATECMSPCMHDVTFLIVLDAPALDDVRVHGIILHNTCPSQVGRLPAEAAAWLLGGS